MLRRAIVVTAAVILMGLTFAAPPVAAGGGGCHSPLTEARGTAVEIKEACFYPTNLYVEPGDKVTWVNRDDFGHVVVGGSWGRFEEMGRADRVSFRFDDPGVYAYTCYLHPGMNGSVIVGKVKAPTTEFEIRDEFAPSEVSNPSTPEPAADATEPAPATVASTSGTSDPWQAAGFVTVGLILGAGGTMGARRVATRRSRVTATAG